MNIVFLVASHLELLPNLLAMIQSNVDDDGSDSGKGETVGQSELGRKK